jgi:hypothetical protein
VRTSCSARPVAVDQRRVGAGVAPGVSFHLDPQRRVGSGSFGGLTERSFHGRPVAFASVGFGDELQRHGPGWPQAQPLSDVRRTRCQPNPRLEVSLCQVHRRQLDVHHGRQAKRARLLGQFKSLLQAFRPGARRKEIDGAQLVQGAQAPHRQPMLLGNAQRPAEGRLGFAQLTVARYPANHLQRLASYLPPAGRLGCLNGPLGQLARLVQPTLAKRHMGGKSIDLRSRCPSRGGHDLARLLEVLGRRSPLGGGDQGAGNSEVGSGQALGWNALRLQPSQQARAGDLDLLVLACQGQRFEKSFLCVEGDGARGPAGFQRVPQGGFSRGQCAASKSAPAAFQEECCRLLWLLGLLGQAGRELAPFARQPRVRLLHNIEQPRRQPDPLQR